MTTTKDEPKEPKEPTAAEKAAILREAVSYYLRTGGWGSDETIREVCEEFVAESDDAARGKTKATGETGQHHPTKKP